jgi:hypothetical protein
MLPVEVPWHVDEFGSENDDAVSLEDGLGDRSGQAAQHVTRTVNLDRLKLHTTINQMMISTFDKMLE